MAAVPICIRIRAIYGMALAHVAADRSNSPEMADREGGTDIMGLALGKKPGRTIASQAAKGLGQTTKSTAELLESRDNETALKDLGLAKMLLCRVRYFTDDAVIGGKEFVNEAFANARERFGPKRKDGARAMRGSGSGAKGLLWSMRDLRVGV